MFVRTQFDATGAIGGGEESYCCSTASSLSWFHQPLYPSAVPDESESTGENLEELLERIIFADPVTHRIREEWKATKREAQELFERACREQYEVRLDYHRTCAVPNAEELAAQDAALIRPMLEEEKEQRLALLWMQILRRVNDVLADKATESVDAPDTSSAQGTGDTSGTA
ncbi:MAG: hypothetical protein L0241_20110 [Planctomycetia bacterium]|nr:hypothetical protein [Planctomycetia bacterium]